MTTSQTVFANRMVTRPPKSLAQAMMAARCAAAVSAPDGTPCTVLSLENLGIVPGQHVANDLESPILPAASLLSHDHPAYVSAHTIRKRESQQGAKQ